MSRSSDPDLDSDFDFKCRDDVRRSVEEPEFARFPAPLDVKPLSQPHSPQSLLSPSSTLVPATPVTPTPGLRLGEPIISPERERFLRREAEGGMSGSASANGSGWQSV